MQIWRNGAARDLSLTLGEMEPDRVAQRSNRTTPPAAKDKEPAPNALGLVVSDIAESKRKELKVEGGVVVDAVDGAAARAGLRAGDIILKLQSTDITGARQFNELVAKLDAKRVVAVLVKRGETSQYVTIRPDRK